MRRIKSGSNEYLIGFHTQESRTKILEFPEKCRRGNAWLGVGFYFWTDIEFAHYWGMDSKKNTGYYDIYTAHINEDKVLNASFNEDEYDFFVRSIEKARIFLAKRHQDINLTNVNRFLADKVWEPLGIKGIIFDDLPQNTISKTFSDIVPLYYIKRIQIVIFDKNNIITFAPHLIKEKCN